MEASRIQYRIRSNPNILRHIDFSWFDREASVTMFRDAPRNLLYYGDNLEVLRKEIKSESVDLIYLDPPFNSNANYNVLYKSPEGQESQAQIEAFEDTWHWNEHTEQAYDEMSRSGYTEAFEMLRSMRSFLKENDMMAYLTMMAIRLVELHRVLKPTGSLYLHCDPTASHYLKILLDAIFGKKNFVNEIIWSYRTGGASKKHWSRKHDVIFFYAKTNTYYFEAQKERIYYDKPFFSPQQDEEGRWYSDVYMRDVWEIPAVINVSKERLGYPTQKPIALLERILAASSKPGDVVLDPFCGCGTSIHAAQKLGRAWIGIDVTHLAISLIGKRLKDAFPDVQFEVRGAPKDLEGARALAARNKYQFQWWAGSLVDAVPHGGMKKGADSGIDGDIYFKPDGKTTERAIVSVKGGENVSVSMIRDLGHVIDRERAKIGLFITLAEPTGPMKTEAIKAGFIDTPFHGKVPKIQILTIKELFDGRKPQIPFVDAMAFRRAAREEGSTEQGSLL